MTAEHDDNRRILERLSNALGPTGFEGPVREIVREELELVVDSIGNDGLGSVISELKGASSSPRIMFAAHMDELGLMVRRITTEGYIKIQPLGGWLDQALINQRWIILTREGEIPGVSGIKTPHVMSQDARSKIFKRDDIFIDVGASSKEDAEDRLNIRPGDAIAPASYFQEMEGNCLYMGKAWDDRAGVAVMLQTIKRLKQLGHPNTVYGVATVQEEVGLRGAQTSAFAVSPDIGISLESGVAGDYPGITADEAGEYVKYITIINDISLRKLIPAELAKGFGFFQSKPHSALGKYALSVDWIKNATWLPQVNWENSRLSANMIIELNGERVGKINTAQEMTFSFARLIEHAAKTRTLSEGTLIGSGTVSSSVSMDGFACLLERNAVFNDKPELYLKHGDRITMYIEGLKETLIIDQRIA